MRGVRRLQQEVPKVVINSAAIRVWLDSLQLNTWYVRGMQYDVRPTEELKYRYHVRT